MAMHAKYYCETMYSELTGLKARIYDIYRALDKMPKANKDKLIPQTTELHALMENLSEKIDRLKQECPVDWRAQKSGIEAAKQKLVEKINWWDAEHIAGGYVGG
jgi:hypothetical protein